MAKHEVTGVRRGLEPSRIIEDASPGNGLRRGSRATRVSAANYDMKYHPMDEATRPNSATTRKHNPLGDDEDDNGLEIRRNNYSLSVSSHRSESAKTGVKNRRRSERTRTMSRRRKEYDMSRHPIDDAIPVEGASRKRKKSSDDEPSSQSAFSVRQTVEGSDADGPEGDGDNNLFSMEVDAAFYLLHSFDKRLYSIQNGLPDCSILPLTWRQVSDRLIRKKWLTRQQYLAWGGESALRERYERLRKHIQGEAAASREPKRKQDWKVRWAEGWDVFDLKLGEDYEERRTLPRIKGLTARGKLVLEDSSSDEEEGSTIVVADSPNRQTYFDLTQQKSSPEKDTSEEESSSDGSLEPYNFPQHPAEQAVLRSDRLFVSSHAGDGSADGHVQEREDSPAEELNTHSLTVGFEGPNGDGFTQRPPELPTDARWGRAESIVDDAVRRIDFQPSMVQDTMTSRLLQDRIVRAPTAPMHARVTQGHDGVATTRRADGRFGIHEDEGAPSALNWPAFYPRSSHDDKENDENQLNEEEAQAQAEKEASAREGEDDAVRDELFGLIPELDKET